MNVLICNIMTHCVIHSENEMVFIYGKFIQNVF